MTDHAETIYIFLCFYNFGFNFFPKRFRMQRSCLILRYGRTHVISSNLRRNLSSLLSSRNADLHGSPTAASSDYLKSQISSYSFKKDEILKHFLAAAVCTPNITHSKRAEPSKINKK